MYEEFEDTKWVIRIRKSKKDRQHNGQKKKDKGTNNDLQNITHKSKDLYLSYPFVITMFEETKRANQRPQIEGKTTPLGKRKWTNDK